MTQEQFNTNSRKGKHLSYQYNLRCVYFCCFLIFKNWLFLKTPIFYCFFRKISNDDCLGSKKGHKKETPSFWGLIK